MSTDSCIWPHYVDRLVGVTPCPVGDLPQVCTCGSRLTYSEDLVFITRPDNPLDPFSVCKTCGSGIQDIEGWIWDGTKWFHDCMVVLTDKGRQPKEPN